MHLLLLATGSVQAANLDHYVSTLRREEWDVRVALTPTAERFVSAQVLSVTTGVSVFTNADFFDRLRPLHTKLARWADVVVVAPLSANTMAKLAVGLADNLVTASFLAASCPRLVCPHTGDDMWRSAATMRNARLLEEDGVHVVWPDKRLAYVCSEETTRVGIAMPGPAELASEIRALREETLSASRDCHV